MYYCDSKNDDRKYVDTIRMLEFDDSANGIMLQPLCNGKNHTSWIPSQDDPPVCLMTSFTTTFTIQRFSTYVFRDFRIDPFKMEISPIVKIFFTYAIFAPIVRWQKSTVTIINNSYIANFHCYCPLHPLNNWILISIFLVVQYPSALQQQTPHQSTTIHKHHLSKYGGKPHHCLWIIFFLFRIISGFACISIAVIVAIWCQHCMQVQGQLHQWNFCVVSQLYHIVIIIEIHVPTDGYSTISIQILWYEMYMYNLQATNVEIISIVNIILTACFVFHRFHLLFCLLPSHILQFCVRSAHKHLVAVHFSHTLQTHDNCNDTRWKTIAIVEPLICVCLATISYENQSQKEQNCNLFWL